MLCVNWSGVSMCAVCVCVCVCVCAVCIGSTYVVWWCGDLLLYRCVAVEARDP